jgi:hypothetical protein
VCCVIPLLPTRDKPYAPTYRCYSPAVTPADKVQRRITGTLKCSCSKFGGALEPWPQSHPGDAIVKGRLTECIGQRGWGSIGGQSFNGSKPATLEKSRHLWRDPAISGEIPATRERRCQPPERENANHREGAGKKETNRYKKGLQNLR